MWNLEKMNSQSGRVISQGQGIEEMGVFAKEYKLVVVNMNKFWQSDVQDVNYN